MRAGATGLAQFDQHTQQSRVFLQHHHGGGGGIGGLFACRCFPRAPDVQSTLDSRVALKEPWNCFDVCRVALRSKEIFNNKARNVVFGSVACEMCTNMLSLFLGGVESSSLPVWTCCSASVAVGGLFCGFLCSDSEPCAVF